MSDPKTGVTAWPTYRGLGIYRTNQAHHKAGNQHVQARIESWSRDRLHACFAEPTFYAVPDSNSFRTAINRMQQFEEMAIQQQRKKL